jgi:hypothetical protein
MMEVMVIKKYNGSLKIKVVSGKDNLLECGYVMNTFAEESIHLKIVDWLLGYHLEFDSIFLANGGLLIKLHRNGDVSFGDRFDVTRLHRSFIRSGNGMRLVSVMPAVRKLLNCYHLLFFNLSTLASDYVFISIYPPGIKSNLAFTT